MADLLVDLEDEVIHTLLHRAVRNGRSLNDEMLAIVRGATIGDPIAQIDRKQQDEFIENGERRLIPKDPLQ